MSLLTSAIKTDLYRFFSIAFNAAPGVTYMNQLATAVESGMTVKQIVNVFTAKTEFTSTYPSFYTADQFANKLVETVVGTSATDAAKTSAKADIVAALNAGWSRGDVVYQIFNNLANKASTDATWGTTSTQMANKVAVAQYYTEDLLTDTTTLSTLRAVIANVTATTDVSTAAAKQAVIDVAVPADAQSFTLTTGSDVKTLGAGADSFYGSLTTAGTTDTLTAGDNLNGAGGIDTLYITANGTGAIASANPTLTNIEKVLVSNAVSGTGITGVTIDMSLADSNVTNIGTNASSTASDVTLFKNVSKLTAAEMRGVGDLTVTYVSSVVSGTGDAQTLTLNGVGSSATGLSTFDVNGIETLNVASATTANYAKLGSTTTTLKTINVSGAQTLTLDLSNATGVTKIDASAATAAVSATGIGATNTTVTGGSANDTFNFGANFDATTQTGSTQKDVVAGGSGTDTLIIDQGTGSNLDALFGQVTSVETLTLNGTGAGSVTLDAKALAAGFATVNLSGTANSSVTIGTGFSGSLTVNLSTGAANTVSNAGGSGVTNLTVRGSADAFTTGDVLTGATGAAYVDTVNLTANGNDGTGTGYVGAVFGTGFTNFDQITISANTGTATLGVEVTLDAANVASGKTLAVDASALTSASAALYLDGSSGVAGSKLSVTGGAGNDTIILGSGNDVVDGGAGNDAITAGAGNDNLSGGAGNDTFTFGDNLSTGDTVNGGDGTDTIVLGTGAVTSAMFTNVTNVENLQFSGSATLTGNIPFSSFDLSVATGAGALTLGSGYTNATTVTLGTGDTVDNSGANAALTVNVTAAAFGTGTGLVVTGGTGVDTLNITASTGTGAVTVNASSKVDVINVVDGGDGTGAGNDMSIVLGSGYSVSVTLDASALDAGTNTSSGTANADWENLTFDASNIASTKTVSVTGGAGHDSITGGAGNDTISGGAGNDTITAGAGYDRLDGGAGNDTFVMGENLSGDDVIAGGDGTDKITIGTGAITDLAFLQVTGIEALGLGVDGGSLTLDTRAQAAGVATVTAGSTGAATTTVSVAGFTNAVTIDASTATSTGAFSLTGGAGNDTFVFAGSGVLSSDDTVVGGAGTDVLQLNNGTGAGTAVNVTLGSGISSIESFVVNDQSTGSVSVTVALAAGFGKSTQSTFNLDASSLDAGESLIFSNGSTGNVLSSGTGYLAVTVKGGAGDDTITGGAKSVDTIDLSVGGADTVVITTATSITAVDQISGFLGGTGAGGDKLDLFGTGTSAVIGTGNTNLTFGYDTDGTGTGALTTTAFDIRTASQDVTLGDGVGTGLVPADVTSGGKTAGSDVVLVVNGATTLDLTKVVSTSTAAKGELLVTDNADAYVLQAAETTSTSFNLYHIYDSTTGTGGVITPEVELVAQVTLASGTFADLKAGNIA